MRENEGWDGFFPTKDDFIDIMPMDDELEQIYADEERYLFEMGHLDENGNINQPLF